MNQGYKRHHHHTNYHAYDSSVSCVYFISKFLRDFSGIIWPYISEEGITRLSNLLVEMKL